MYYLECNHFEDSPFKELALAKLAIVFVLSKK